MLILLIFAIYPVIGTYLSAYLFILSFKTNNFAGLVLAMILLTSVFFVSIFAINYYVKIIRNYNNSSSVEEIK